ncbi:MAG TPA: ACP phosphodiesterase [Candidatus Saccharimonadia bacterium]|nr:ACP phosphodiesterase [Candidatus Saccharimonadia bacterium]
MNHLAHAVLAGDEPGMIVGSLLGDFWRGALDPAWPEPLGRGVRLHRRTDVVTDSHAAVVAARARFEPPLRRYAGILLDVWFDHVLARDYERFAGEPLAPRLARVYAALADVPASAPASYALFAERTRRHDTLGRYEDPEFVESVFELIGARLAHANPVAHAYAAVAALDAPITRAFQSLWPDLIALARTMQRGPIAATPAHTNAPLPPGEGLG